MKLLQGLSLAATIASGLLIGAPPETNSIGMKLVPIQPGSFRMGQDGAAHDFRLSRFPDRVNAGDWDEKPVHSVAITKPFALGATEVTNLQYELFDPEHKKLRGKSGVSQGDHDAVVWVNWDDAMNFCKWLSKKEGRTYRLPTEAEWEYACRAGTTTLYSSGDRLPKGYQKWILPGRRDYFFQSLKGAALPAEYGDLKTLEVGQTQANPWGLYDMHGNVAEWVHDWYGPYEAAPQSDPVGRIDGDFRVVRGGSHSKMAVALRSANRTAYLPHVRHYDLGFRVVLGDLPATRPMPKAAPPMNARNVSQTIPKITRRVADLPYFKGPRVFVQVAKGAAGPAYIAHNHSPAITECPNGDLLAVWYSCVEEPGDELLNLASRLRLGSEEWEDASLFWDQPDVNDHAPKIWWDGKRTIFHFANGLTENIIRSSTDNGATWSKVMLVEPVGELGNSPILTREGWITLPYDERTASLAMSKDGGKSWSSIRAEKWDWEPRKGAPRNAGIHNGLVQLKDGRLFMLGRIDPADVQARFGIKTPMSISSDMGKTWDVTASEFPAISSAQRPALLRLQEGPLLFLSFTDQARDRKNRKGMTFKHSGGGEFTGYGMFAALSYDEGVTWPVRRLVTPGGPDRHFLTTDNGDLVLNETNAEWLGYIAATQARDGTIHVISSKNHYEFNLAWIKQLPAPPR